MRRGFKAPQGAVLSVRAVANRSQLPPSPGRFRMGVLLRRFICPLGHGELFWLPYHSIFLLAYLAGRFPALPVVLSGRPVLPRAKGGSRDHGSAGLPGPFRSIPDRLRAAFGSLILHATCGCVCHRLLSLMRSARDLSAAALGSPRAAAVELLPLAAAQCNSIALLHPFRMACRLPHALHFNLSDFLNLTAGRASAGRRSFPPLALAALAHLLARSTCGVLPCAALPKAVWIMPAGRRLGLKRTVALASVPGRRPAQGSFATGGPSGTTAGRFRPVGS